MGPSFQGSCYSLKKGYWIPIVSVVCGIVVVTCWVMLRVWLVVVGLVVVRLVSDGSMGHILGSEVGGDCAHVGSRLGFPMGWRGAILEGMGRGGLGYDEVV